MNDNFEREIIKRFDTVIKLLTLSLGKSQKEKIKLLNGAGFSPKEIADILSTTGNTVRVALFNIRKKIKKKKDEENVIFNKENEEFIEEKKENENKSKTNESSL